jgi:hypothetical protein
VVGLNTQTGNNSTFTATLQSNASLPTVSNPFATEYTFPRFYSGGKIYAAAAAINQIVVRSSKIDKDFLKNVCRWTGYHAIYDEGAKTCRMGLMSPPITRRAPSISPIRISTVMASPPKQSKVAIWKYMLELVFKGDCSITKRLHLRKKTVTYPMMSRLVFDWRLSYCIYSY